MLLCEYSSFPAFIVTSAGLIQKWMKWGEAQTLFTQQGETRVPAFLMASYISHNCFPSGNLIYTDSRRADQQTHNTWILCVN